MQDEWTRSVDRPREVSRPTTVEKEDLTFIPGARWLPSYPTAEGWYWYKPNGSTRITGPVEVFYSFGELHCAVGGNGMKPVFSYAAQWAGPLPRPEV